MKYILLPVTEKKYDEDINLLPFVGIIRFLQFISPYSTPITFPSRLVIKIYKKGHVIGAYI